MGLMRAVFLSAQFLLALILIWMGFSLASCADTSQRTHRAELSALAGAPITSVAADRIDQANEGRLVHVVGRTRLDSPLPDPLLGIVVDGLALRREVQMYQWEESATTSRTASAHLRPDQCTDESVRVKILGGVRVRERQTVYSYSKVWSPRKLVLGCEGRLPIYTNPAWTLESATIEAQESTAVRVGAFRLSAHLPSELTEPRQPFTIAPEQIGNVLPAYRARAAIAGGSLYVGDTRAPAIGDLKISYQVAPFPEVTVVAEQARDSLVPHDIAGVGHVLEVEAGRRSLEDLKREWRGQRDTTWDTLVLSAPFFLPAAFFLFWPLRALLRGVVGPNVSEAAVLVFTPVLAFALGAASVALMRWRAGAGGALDPALVALAAAAALLPLAAWRSRVPRLGTGELLRRAYAAFNARDVEGVLATLHPQVKWANGMEGGFVHGHQGVRDYWKRQWRQVDPHVDPLGWAPQPDGRVVVDVHQVVRDLTGTVLQDRTVRHAYRIENGLIARMDILEEASPC